MYEEIKCFTKFLVITILALFPKPKIMRAIGIVGEPNVVNYKFKPYDGSRVFNEAKSRPLR